MQITNTQDLLQNYAYQNDFTFFESSTPQTTLLYLKANGVYQVSFVGGGGGADGGCSDSGRHGASRKRYHRNQPGRGGGSGAAFSGNVYLVKGYYQITVGAGGAGGPRVHGKGGARGGNGSVSQMLYSANSDMSNPKVVIVCNGGGGASASSCAYHGSHPGNPGAGGQVSISSDLIVKDLFLKTNGLNGVGEAGGNSVYSGTTYGKGGNAYSNPGNSGYVKVKLL